MYQFATYHARVRNIITKCLKLFYIQRRLRTHSNSLFIIKKKKSLPNFTSTGIFYQIKALQQSINLSV